ncbi:MAG TPA: Gfo/Idh/MocA family oxidoreductase [Geobacterales bacterium]|nr:Gfo/Idh/MocA family oxidoreductase [Geobacterales bacterium]
MLKLALIGLGYWGRNYLRVLKQIPDVNLAYVYDTDQNKLLRSKDVIARSLEEIIEDKEINAVIIATPASTHYEIGKKLIESNKHVLIEKPLTMKYEEALELAKLAKIKNRVLMVGHIYCYNSAINYMKEIIKEERLGKLYYGFGLRCGFGPIRYDASCTWDLATHDLAMLDYLLEDFPIEIQASATYFLRKGVYDYANINLSYENGFIFNLTVSWYAAEKIRSWYLIGSERMLKFDDTNKNNPIVIYNKRVKEEKLGEYSEIKMLESEAVIPYINYEEPLLLQVMHFLECIKENKKPLSDARQGARIVKLLELIDEAILKGERIKISKDNVEQ